MEDLLEQLARPGGGSAPPTLDSLLAQDPMRDVQSASLRAVVEAQDSAEAERELPDIEPSVRPAETMPPARRSTPAQDTVPGPR